MDSFSASAGLCLKLQVQQIDFACGCQKPHFVYFCVDRLQQHYDRRRNFEKAVEKIDEAISHTPTVIDLYLVKV